MYFINAMYVFIIIVFLILMIIGLTQCAKSSFKAGFIFFLIIMLHKVYSYGSPYLINRILDAPPFGMSIAAFLSLHHLMLLYVEVIAYGILVIGLYYRWNRKKAESNP